ncbi:MAG TPA: SIS domain-containing protein [Vicinamibacterales bacterium]|jgi:phosphoheptose isomerase|nr:SIS domain-containing protein [Vicinamibacterales bacterium]
MRTMSEPAAAVKAVVDACIAVHERLRGENLQPVADAAAAILAASRDGGKVLVFGNGGSAADAQHLATDLVGRFQRERRAVAAVPLTADGSLLTAVANDYAFDRVFVRQIEALGTRGDLAFGISTSGRSANVVEALRAARARGLRTIALTGNDGGPAGALADIHINVPDPSTARVQEAHRTLIHAICELVEREL